VRLVGFYLQSRLLRAIALTYVVCAAWVTCFGEPSETRIPPYRIDVDVYRLGGLAVLAQERRSTEFAEHAMLKYRLPARCFAPRARAWRRRRR